MSQVINIKVLLFYIVLIVLPPVGLSLDFVPFGLIGLFFYAIYYLPLSFLGSPFYFAITDIGAHLPNASGMFLSWLAYSVVFGIVVAAFKIKRKS